MTLLLWALILFLTGAAAAALLRWRPFLATLFGATGAVFGGLVGLLAAGSTLLSATAESFTYAWQLPSGHFALLLDSLSAFFLLPIFLLVVVCALYGVGYQKGTVFAQRAGSLWFFFNLFAASMVMVVAAANAVLFLMAWELMSLTSFFLVAFEHDKEVVRRASWLYLIATHLGAAFLFAFFLLISSWLGETDFAAFATLENLPAAPAACLFLLALTGFGAKAGMFPLHVWLPDAHPAAPSHVSALMSGVMIKVGIYGLLRMLGVLPLAPAWWGCLIAVLGMLGALYGIAMACLQSDIKRCLAYSTVENVGIIFLALGIGMVASAQGLPVVALLAYTGALLHIWNHALFKGLMFLGAGALLHATGTRNMNRMGGLLKRMPLTGLLWIGGALAISALPPFNGLVSEWLIYLSLLQAGTIPSSSFAMPALLLVGLLGVVGALALLTFARLIGICLLGEPRHLCAQHAHESSTWLLLPMALLLAGCLWIGLFPQSVVKLLQQPLAQLLRQPGIGMPQAPLVDFGLFGGVLLLVLLLAFFMLHRLRKVRPHATAATWGCGFRFPSARMTYTGAAFSELTFRHLLPRLLRPAVQGAEVHGLHPAATYLVQTSLDPVLTRSFRPIFLWIGDRSQRLRWLQQGQLHIYLFYMFAASALLLIWSLWAGRGG